MGWISYYVRDEQTEEQSHGDIEAPNKKIRCTMQSAIPQAVSLDLPLRAIASQNHAITGIPPVLKQQSDRRAASSPPVCPWPPWVLVGGRRLITCPKRTRRASLDTWSTWMDGPRGLDARPKVEGRRLPRIARVLPAAVLLWPPLLCGEQLISRQGLVTCAVLLRRGR